MSVELTDSERNRIYADFAAWESNTSLDCEALVLTSVESIVAARVQALTAERDEARKNCTKWIRRYNAAIDDWHAELAAANTRCAELEGEISEGFPERDLLYEQIAALQATLDRVTAETESVIDAIEETFLPQLPTKALSYCAQEDVNAGLDAMRERFGLEAGR